MCYFIWTLRDFFACVECVQFIWCIYSSFLSVLLILPFLSMFLPLAHFILTMLYLVLPYPQAIQTKPVVPPSHHPSPSLWLFEFSPKQKWKPPLKHRPFQNSASFCFTKIYHITVYSSQVILFNGKFPPFQYSFYCSVNAPTTVITRQALTSMTRLMSSGNNTCVLKDLVPALKNSLLHTGGLLSAGQLQRMLAHCRQELENQLSAFRLTSTTFATERRRGGKCLHSSTCQGKSPLPGQPSTL